MTANTVEVYPNPASNVLYITPSFDLTGGQVKIVDLLGREVIVQTENLNVIDLSRIDSGIYTVEAISGENKVVKRFIKN
jgi:hypothetical protein